MTMMMKRKSNVVAMCGYARGLLQLKASCFEVTYFKALLS